MKPGVQAAEDTAFQWHMEKKKPTKTLKPQHKKNVHKTLKKPQTVY